MLLISDDSLIELIIKRKDSIFSLQINQKGIMCQNLLSNKLVAPYQIINDSIVYINAGRCNEKEMDSYLKKAKSFKHIIFDFREYPAKQPLGKSMAKYLVQEEKIFCKFEACANISKPGYYIDKSNSSTRDGNIKIHPQKAKRYSKAKKFYFIIDEETISRGEFLTLYFKSHTNGICIGKPTAGVPSNVIVTKLPNIGLKFTSVFKLWDDKGNLISGNGINPEVLVEEDITSYNQLENILVNYLKAH